MKKYWLVFKIAWQDFFEYRANILLYFVGSIAVMVATLFLWLAVYQSKTTVGDYNVKEMITYLFLVNFLGSVVFTASGKSADYYIRKGTLSFLLVKPINPNMY